MRTGRFRVELIVLTASPRNSYHAYKSLTDSRRRPCFNLDVDQDLQALAIGQVSEAAGLAVVMPPS